MLRVLALLIRFLTVVAASASIAHAADGATGAVSAQGRRVALVIGNGDYRHPENLPRLPNPPNDAQDIATALRGFGFEVIERRNQTLEAMNQSIADFGSRIGGSEAALFYFAGHGIQVRNQNYLMAVDARVESEAGVPYQGVDLNRVLDEMDNAKSRVNIVMLDACRNNPITGKFRGGRSRGLASPGSVPKGTVIVYATDPGNVAADGEGRNGLFTAGLLTAFKGKDLSLDDVLTVASAEVERISGNTQTPYVNGPQTLKKNFHFLVTADAGKGESEKTYWASIERSGDAADFEAYLRKYPNGSYRQLAESRLGRLKAASQAVQPPVAAAAVSPAPTILPVPAASDWRPGKVFKDCADCPEMVVIPAGSFEMGSNSGHGDERPVHGVKIGKALALGKTEVTQRQWRAVMGSNPSGFSNCGDDCPVEKVNWDDAQDFVRKLSQKTGKSYRLPSEAEWEYACRGGGRDEYCGGGNIDSVAWYGNNSGSKSHPVAGKQANAWGLYDMGGNVREWTEDCYNHNYSGAPTDGSAWTSGNCEARVLRGASWDSHPSNAGAAYRSRYLATIRDLSYGFRPARTLP